MCKRAEIKKVGAPTKKGTQKKEGGYIQIIHIKCFKELTSLIFK